MKTPVPDSLSRVSEVCNFIEHGTPTQGFFCEFCEIFKNTFFTEHRWAAASEFKDS